MPEFVFQARDANGTTRRGRLDAPSRGVALGELKQRGWVILRLEEPEASRSGQRQRGLAFRLPARSIHVEMALRELALMIGSGMTLLAALESLIRQAPQSPMAGVWREVSEAIRGGQSFADALSEHRCIPPFVIQLIRIGEQTGDFSVVMDRAAETMRDRRRSREAFWSAAVYPVLIVFMAVAVTAYMVLYLIPRLQEYLASLGRELPAMTQTLVDGSAWLRENQHFVLGSIVLIGGLIAIAWNSESGRLAIDRMLLRIPLGGRLVQLSETAAFSRSLSIMLKSGITLTHALESVEQIVTNRYLRTVLSFARDSIIRGGNLADALEQRPGFSPLLARMAHLGQQTGELDRVLGELAELSEEQFDVRVRRLSSILTPLVTLAIGGIVGYVYVAFFMALIAAGT